MNTNRPGAVPYRHLDRLVAGLLEADGSLIEEHLADSIEDAVTAVVGGAPADMDTLQELSQARQRDVETSLKLSSAELEGLQAARRGAGRAVVNYADAVLFTHNFSALPTVRTASAHQVSNNQIFDDGVSSVANQMFSLPFPRNVTPGERFHISFPFTIAALGAGAYLYFGLDAADFASASTTVADAAVIGVTGSGVVDMLGLGFSGQVVPPADRATIAGDYMGTIDGDENSISLFMRHVTDTSRNFGWKIPVSTFTGLSKTFGRMSFFLGDARGLTGNSIGPVTGVFSQQPSRTKIVAGTIQSEGRVVRDVYKTAVSSSDDWRYALPPSYDPRVPAPLVLYLHQAQSTVTTTDRPWEHANERPMMAALASAGYIVATARDGHVVGNLNSDRYGNDASMSNFADLYRHMRSRFAISSVVLYGVSMGGMTAANILARRDIPNIAAVYLINPGLDLAAAYAGSYTTPINTAYGIGGGVTYATATEGHDPLLMEGRDLRGVPLRIVASSEDVAANPSDYENFLAGIEPYTTEASQLTVTGAHLAAGMFQSADLMSFLGRHVPTT